MENHHVVYLFFIQKFGAALLLPQIGFMHLLLYVR